MKKLLWGVVLVVTMVSYSARAAETTVHGRLFGEWRLDQTDGAGGFNEFSLNRSYLTAKSKLSEYTAARITIDLRETTATDGHSRYDLLVKYGYFDWQPHFANGNITFRFGLQPTMYIDIQNKLWGRRYLQKTVSDLVKFMTSSDLGASIHYSTGADQAWGTIVGAVYNGTSYSALGDRNKHKDFNGVLVVTPLQGNMDFRGTTLLGQYYYGVQNQAIPDSASGSDYKRQLISVGGLLEYRELFNIGGDFNWNTTGAGVGNPDLTATGFTVHGTLYFSELAGCAPVLRTLDIFGRVDLSDPDVDTDDDGNTLVIAGVECAPIKGFKAALNYRTTSFEDDTQTTEKSIHFNTLVKF